MRKIISAIFFATTIATASLLGGCATNPDGSPVVTAPDIRRSSLRCRGYCQVACGFVPTVTTIANIISAGNPAIATAGAISAAICAAINPPKALRRRATFAIMVKGWRVTPGAVNGVPVR